VTGAGSGIGRATAAVIAELGGAVAATDINLSAAEETAKTITNAGGQARASSPTSSPSASSWR
jgi:NAD(P)-dependent dehydrogenase (short-subunit alcohol dehydrogenase family)